MELQFLYKNRNRCTKTCKNDWDDSFFFQLCYVNTEHHKKNTQSDATVKTEDQNKGPPPLSVDLHLGTGWRSEVSSVPKPLYNKQRFPALSEEKAE
jgi:hypothetical protein